MSKIAVLGLGAMGLPMATRLAEKFTVTGFDPSETRRELAASKGLAARASARDAARDADVVLLAVRNTEQLGDALYGEDGVVQVLPTGALIVLTSTVGIDDVQRFGKELEQAGYHLVDAPISGGPARAGTGDLLIVVGANDHAYELATPVLEQLASTLERMGDAPGAGQAMKTVNQLLCGIHIAAGAEALALAGALGLDPEQALRTLGAGAAASFMLADRGPRMLEAYGEGAEVRSRLDIFVKDMGIVSDAAQGAGLPTPVAAAAEQLYLVGQRHGLAAKDDSSVITVLAPEGR